GQVVAPQPQRGRAEQHTREHRDRDRHREHDPDVVVRCGRELRRRVRTHRVERDVAEVEQARLADDDVQPEREQDVEPDREEQDRLPLELQVLREQHGGDEERDAHEALGPPSLLRPPTADELDRRPPPHERPYRRHQARALPSASPSRPVGRTMRTTTRMPKAKTSCHRPPSNDAPYFSSTPSNRPPSRAPRMLPMPPSTAAVNALIPGRNPML